jgi:hypothetical protein
LCAPPIWRSALARNQVSTSIAMVVNVPFIRGQARSYRSEVTQKRVIYLTNSPHQIYDLADTGTMPFDLYK